MFCLAGVRLGEVGKSFVRSCGDSDAKLADFLRIPAAGGIPYALPCELPCTLPAGDAALAFGGVNELCRDAWESGVSDRTPERGESEQTVAVVSELPCDDAESKDR